MGFELPPDFPMISTDQPRSGAQSGAPRAPGDNLADPEPLSPAFPEPDPDPLLTRFLNAWNRLGDADRLRLVDEAERLADVRCDALAARPRRKE
jgi:hypothetical protein